MRRSRSTWWTGCLWVESLPEELIEPVVDLALEPPQAMETSLVQELAPEMEKEQPLVGQWSLKLMPVPASAMKPEKVSSNTPSSSSYTTAFASASTPDQGQTEKLILPPIPVPSLAQTSLSPPSYDKMASETGFPSEDQIKKAAGASSICGVPGAGSCTPRVESDG